MRRWFKVWLQTGDQADRLFYATQEDAGNNSVPRYLIRFRKQRSIDWLNYWDTIAVPVSSGVETTVVGPGTWFPGPIDFPFDVENGHPDRG